MADKKTQQSSTTKQQKPVAKSGSKSAVKPGPKSGPKSGAERVVDDVENKPPQAAFPIVAIGASAGGFVACEAFLREMPADAGLAIVVIQHLDPTFKSLLADLLGKRTEMPVKEACHDMLIEPNSVYVIPPNQYLAITAGRLQLQEPDKARGMRMPIDHFFCSLAESHREWAIAVVLSGIDGDGTQGIRHINETGGFILAQTADSSEYPGMPTSALGTGLVDFELPP